MEDFFWRYGFPSLILFFILVLAVSVIPKTQEVCQMAYELETEVCTEVPTMGVGWPIFLGKVMHKGNLAEGFSGVSFLLNVLIYGTASFVLVVAFRGMS